MLSLFDKVASLFYQKQGQASVSERTAIAALQLVHILNLMSHGAMPVDMEVDDNDCVVFTTSRGRVFVTCLFEDSYVRVECFDGLSIYPKENPDPPKPATHDAPATLTCQTAGSKGGRARAAALSPEARKLIAVKAAKARWNKVSQQPSRCYRSNTVDPPVLTATVFTGETGAESERLECQPEGAGAVAPVTQATVTSKSKDKPPKPVRKRKAKPVRKRKVSDAQAVEIHRRYANGEATMAALAREYNINPTIVFYIIHGVTYKHLCLPTVGKRRKFTDADVRNIRHAVLVDGLSHTSVAKMMGGTSGYISQIMKGRNYKDVK